MTPATHDDPRLQAALDTATAARSRGRSPGDQIPESESWPELPAEALRGLAGDVVRTFSPSTEADDAAVLITTLLMFGNCVGRTPHIYVGEARHGTNEFAAIVGKSSRSRKGTSGAGPRRLFDIVDARWQTARRIDGIGSGEGIIWAVRDPSEPKLDKRGETVIEDPGVDDKRLMVSEEELSGLLDVSGRDGSIVGATMRKSWDSPQVLHNTVKRSPVRATGAHVSILGHITIDEARRKLTEADRANGVGNRFIWIAARRSKHLALPERVPDTVILPLARRMGSAIDHARKTSTVTFDADALDLWELVYPALTEDYPGLYGALIARSEAHVLRLSLIYALLDEAKQIRPEHILSALALWRYSELSTRHIFGDSTGDHVADRILAALRASQSGLPESHIHELFNRNEKAARIQSALNDLAQQGKVVLVPEPPTPSESNPDGRGRPRRVWHAVPGATTNGPTGEYLETARAFVRDRCPDDSPFSSSDSFSSSPVFSTNGIHMPAEEGDDDLYF